MTITEQLKQDFYEAFLEAAFHAETELEGYSVDDLCNEAKEAIRAHTDSFLYRAMSYFSAEQEFRQENNLPLKTLTDLAHDFYYTQASHGVGFWEDDRWLRSSEVLEVLAKKYTFEFYVADDNKVYVL
jgi:hypothetical protein